MNRTSFLFLASVAITLVLWILSKADPVLFVSIDTLKAITQICALIGAVGYFFTYILSSKLPFLENLTSLDQLYKTHRLVGTLAGAGILLHVSSLIARLLPLPSAFTLYLIPSTNLSYNVGILAFYLLLVLLITTLYANLPYHIWKLIHKLASFGILFAFLHLLIIPSDISTNLPLRIWMISIATLGMIAWIYKEFLEQFIRNSYEYRVTNIAKADDITVITMQAVKDSIPAMPGSFAFFTFYADNKVVSKESHPFTILDTNKRELAIAVKNLGDYTGLTSYIPVGSKVVVTGPHGEFGKRILQTKEQQVWIGAGIGITPFYSVVSYLQKNGLSHYAVNLFYFTSTPDKIFHPTLLASVKETGIKYTYACTSISGRQLPSNLLSDDTVSNKKVTYFLCGPVGMISSYSEYLLSKGVSQKRIITEAFEFKSLDI